MRTLDGTSLADFRQRAIAFVIDSVLAIGLLLLAIAVYAVCRWLFEAGGRSGYLVHFRLESEVAKFVIEVLVPVLYFGLTTWLWEGRTVGKRLMRIRVVSLVHDRISLWHSVERALGYGAAALEFGFGFVQFFIHPNRRCAQDRLAETIVVQDPARSRKPMKVAAEAEREPASEHAR